MANSLLSISMITKESLMVLHNSCVMLKSVNRTYDNQFANQGAKIGNVINIRLPNRYYVSNGTAIDVQGTTETYTSLTLSNQWHTDMSFTSADLTLSIDEFADRYIKPAMAAIASKIDAAGLNTVITTVYNQVGTAGYTPGMTGGTSGEFSDSSAPNIFLNAGAMLDNFGAPTMDRFIILNPKAQARSVGGLSGLYNDQATIGTQFVSGRMGHALGFEFAMDQNVNRVSIGTHAASSLAGIQVYGANQTGSTLVSKGWTVSQTGVLKAGEVISIAGCYSVNPENQTSTGELAQFVVTSDVNSDGSGYASIPISPSIVLATTGVANGTVASLPAADAQIYLDSKLAKDVTAGTTYPVNVAYHKDAFAFGSADLLLPGGVDYAARESYEGVSLRIVRQYNINSDSMPSRIDVLGGWVCQRPELATRIAG